MAMNARLLRPKATGFNPKQISSLALWLDAADASTLTIDSGVSAWADKSGNGVVASQSDVALRPTYPETLNGKPALVFRSGFRWLSLPLVERNDHTVFVVGDDENGIGNAWLGSSTSPHVYFLAGLGSDTWSANGVASPNGITKGQVSMGGYVRSGSLTTTYGNGVPGTAGTGSFGLPFGFDQIGKYHNNTPYNAVGLLAEILIYDSALATKERQKVEGYLAWKWGLQSQLPSNHPYAYSFPGFGSQARPTNADAQDWVDRVYANGGEVSTSTAAAVNTFCNDIDAASLRDRFYRLNLFCGTGLNAALVPLYRGQSLGATQGGNTTDLNNGPFVSGDYVETGATGGLTGNGTSKHLRTGATSSAWMPQNAGSHVAVYKCTSVNSGVLVSSRFSPGDAALNQIWELGAGGNVAGGATGSFAIPGTHASLLGVTRAGNSAASLITPFRNTVLGDTNSGGNDPAATVVPIVVFARNTATTNADTHSLNLFSNQRLAAYSVGLHLNIANLTSYNAAMQAFQTSLGRNV